MIASMELVHGTNPDPTFYLSNDKESELADFLLECAKIGYGKTRRDVSALWCHTCRRANVSQKTLI